MTERVLFIRLSALGDVVMTLPALSALRAARPELAVDWVVEDRCADLLRLVEGIDRLIVFPRQALARPGVGAIRALGAHLSELRREGYAAAIDFQGNLKGALHLLRARARRRIGPDAASSREGAHWCANVRVPLPPSCHRAERALALVRPLGTSPEAGLQDGVLPPALRPRFVVDGQADAEVAERLAARARPDGPLVVLHPGTSAFGAFKRWPPENWAELARRLREQAGATLLVAHGPDEEPLARRVAEESGGAAAVWPPCRGLAGLAALHQRARLAIGSDSGPLLLASALGTRTVVLFGPKDPAVYASPFGGCAVVRQPVPCSPCSLRRCADPICMSRLEVAPVLEAALCALR